MEELRLENRAELMEKIRSRIHRFCSQAADRLPECRLMLGQVIVEPGKASESILHHVGAGGYDALVMGTRGHGLVKEALLGGTSRKVIRHCPIPVFVVPASAGAVPRSRARR